MGLFRRKPAYCAVCGKEARHRHKPKREWGMEAGTVLCGECHLDKSREYYEGKVRQKCTRCGGTFKITDMWEPRWQWETDGLLCKPCFDEKESTHERRKNFCGSCGAKMGLLRYRPKPKWKMDTKLQLCRGCWDAQKARHG